MQQQSAVACATACREQATHRVVQRAQLQAALIVVTSCTSCKLYCPVCGGGSTVLTIEWVDTQVYVVLEVEMLKDNKVLIWLWC